MKYIYHQEIVFTDGLQFKKYAPKLFPRLFDIYIKKTDPNEHRRISLQKKHLITKTITCRYAKRKKNNEQAFSKKQFPSKKTMSKHSKKTPGRNSKKKKKTMSTRSKKTARNIRPRSI